MAEIDYRALINALLTAANIASPTGKEQMGFVRLINEVRKDGQSDQEICRQIVGALFDGLSSGNWPHGENNEH